MDQRGGLVIETTRLRLRQLTPADAAFMLELLNEPAFITNVADRHVRTLAQAEAFLEERIRSSYREFGFGFYAIERKEEGGPIGIAGFIKREALDDVDIGYSLLARYTGQGFAYEAAAALLDYGKARLQLPRIVAITAPFNTRSIRLLEKLGMKFEKMVQIPGFDRESMLFA